MLSKFIIIFCVTAVVTSEFPKRLARIAGGKNAEPGQYPYHVSLFFNDTFNENVISFCGGAILTNQWIITGAYCVLTIQNVTDIIVKAGSIHYSQFTETEQKSNVMEGFVHPNYTSVIGPYDIGLLKLEIPLIFNKFVTPVDLPQPESIPTGAATLTGLGYLTDITENYIPELLQAITLPVIDNDACQRLIKNLLGDEEAAVLSLLDELRFCTGPTEKNQGYCLHDTGDPLIVKANGKDVLIGVATFGFAADCQTPGAPSIYTRISAFNDWIEENIRINMTYQ